MKFYKNTATIYLRMNQNEDPKDGIFRNNATVCIYDFIIEKSSHEMKAQFLISAVDVLAQLL